MERLGRGEQERVRHREHQDREQDVGDRHEPHQRRPDDLVEARPQVVDDRPVAATRRDPDRRRPRDADDQHPDDDEQDRLEDDERRRADRAGDRPGQQRADEAARDGGAGAQREEPLRLARVEHGPGHRPRDRHPDRPDGVDRQPCERHRRRVIGGHQQPLDEQGDGRPDRQAGQQRDPGQAPERGPIGQRGHEAGRPEADEQVGQRAGPVPADHQRVDADLAEAAARLERREQQRHQRDRPGLAGADADRPGQAVHRSPSTGARGMARMMPSRGSPGEWMPGSRVPCPWGYVRGPARGPPARGALARSGAHVPRTLRPRPLCQIVTQRTTRPRADRVRWLVGRPPTLRERSMCARPRPIPGQVSVPRVQG